MFNNNITRGFTLVELLIVIGIVAMMAAISYPMYNSLQKGTILNETKREVKQAIILSRERSKVGLNSQPHGVFLDVSSNPQRVVIYQGSSYLTRDINYDREILIPDGVTIQTNLATNEINFEEGTGSSSNDGLITFLDDTNHISITIDDTGIFLDSSNIAGI